MEQTYRFVFPNLGTENQNVTNSAIVILFNQIVVSSYQELIITISCSDNLTQEEDEHRDESNVPFEDFEEIIHADVPGKGNSVQMCQKRNREIAEKRHLNALKIYKTIIHHSVGG